MKLYSYSSELLAFVEVKWIIAKFVIGGIFLGIIILFGVIKLNQSVGNAFGIRSTNTLAAENNFLRQQVTLISPQVNNLNMQTRQLNEHANKLRMFLQGSKIARDTVLSFAYVNKKFKLQPMVLAAKSFRH
jgi:hypothetical protein